MTAVGNWLLAALLAGWWVLTVLRNIPRLGVRIGPRDWIGLLPDWALFASPRTYDIALLSREVVPSGQITPWREHVVVVPRPWFSFLWHPTLGPKRALLLLADTISRQAAARHRLTSQPVGAGTIGASVSMQHPSYLQLLSYVSWRSSERASAVQFMLLALPGMALRDASARGASDGGVASDAAVLFVSEFHRLPSRVGPTT